MKPATAIAGVPLSHLAMNAAGTCKTLADVRRLGTSAAGAIVVGSITAQARTGNAGRPYYSNGAYSLNSFGMPNGGTEYYRKHLPAMARASHAAEKPLIVSVAGFSPDEYAALVRLAFDGGADLVELNLGCPNVWEQGTQHRIVSFYPESITEVLDRIGPLERVGVKLSPLSDPELLREVAAVIGSAGFVTASNTFPNAFAAGTPPVTGGFGGPALKPLAVGQIKQLAALLPGMDLVGTGGVRTAADVADYRAAGATAVQAATAYLDAKDPRFFDALTS